jgi:D-galactose 1-dehydrogenase
MPEPVAVTSAELFFPKNADAPIAANFTLSCGGRTKGYSVETDWRPIKKDIWEISIETKDGLSLRLFSGGARLEVNGKVAVDEKAEEYEAIYRHFDRLLKKGESYVDAAPFELVADAFMIGRRKEVERFEE